MIELASSVQEKLLSYARQCHPEEACGVLAGTGRLLEEFYPLSNQDRSGTSFYIDPKELLETVKLIRSKRLRMLAVFHSHLEADAYPSAKDIRLAYDPDLIHLICSLARPKETALRAFRIRDGKVTELKVQLAD